MRAIFYLAFVGTISFSTLSLSDRIDVFRAIETQINDFEAYANKRYGSQGLVAYNKLKALGGRFERLVVDPALVSALLDSGLVKEKKDFITFVKQNLYLDHWKAHSKYAEFLGSIIVYRGLNLSMEEADFVARKGILAPFVLYQKINKDSFAVPFAEQIKKRMTNNSAGSNDFNMSVTDFDCVAKCLFQTGTIHGDAMYLYKIRTSRLNSISLDSHLFDSIDRYSSPAYSQAMQMKIPYRYFESFLSVQVDPKEIVSVEKVKRTDLSPQLCMIIIPSITKNGECPSDYNTLPGSDTISPDTYFH